MSQISNLAIPITINTEKVKPGLQKAEKAVAESASRMSKATAAWQSGTKAFGGEKAIGFAEKFRNSPLGGAAMTGAMVAGPMIAATALFDSMLASVQGSTEALNRFRETGKLAVGMNSAMLELMATAESSLAQRKTAGMGETMAAGAAADPTSVFNVLLDTLKNAWTGTGAFLGSAASGESINQAMLRANIATAPQAEAEALMKQLREATMEANQSSVIIGPIALLSAGINKLDETIRKAFN